MYQRHSDGVGVVRLSDNLYINPDFKDKKYTDYLKWLQTQHSGEGAQKHLRFIRDILLQNSDHTQLSDAPFSGQQKTAWAEYRQELRDLPANTTDYSNPQWPVEP